jgi:hypothetical protein
MGMPNCAKRALAWYSWIFISLPSRFSDEFAWQTELEVQRRVMLSGVRLAIGTAPSTLPRDAAGAVDRQHRGGLARGAVANADDGGKRVRRLGRVPMGDAG